MNAKKKQKTNILKKISLNITMKTISDLKALENFSTIHQFMLEIIIDEKTFLRKLNQEVKFLFRSEI